MRLGFSISLASLLVTLFASNAFADDGKPAQKEEEDDFKPVAVTLNPLGVIVGRYSANVEYLPMQHHALFVNPYYQHISEKLGAGDVSLEQTYSSLGGEIGYRYYTGARGANGFYFGPSLFAQKTSIDQKGQTSQTSAQQDTNFLVYGGSLDIGGQHVTKSGFTIGGGAGVQYLITPASPGATNSSAVKFAGILPRVLLTMGWSF